MRGRADEIDQALTTLGQTVADELSAAGWNHRSLGDDRADATLTRSTQNGIIAVIEVRRTSFQWPDDWPVEVETWLGVGYEAALNLMPLLTLHPRAALIDFPGHGRANGFTVRLTGLDTVAQAAHRIVQFVKEHASAIAHDFPNAAAIDEQLQREIDAACGVPRAFDFETQLHLVVLAVMAEHEQARALLATYPAKRNYRSVDRDDRRFVRQLTRWLDAGGPVAPPVEETLAQLPRRVHPPRPSWSDTRSRSKAKKEALDAARARSKGKSLEQLKALIAAEYGARGIEIAPWAVDFNAGMLQVEQQPFGRARTAVTAIRMLKSSVGDAIRQIKHVTDDDPEWLQPPDRAAYPMTAARSRCTSVELDPAAHDWLERVQAEAPRRIGPWVLIDVWLARDDPAAPLVASVGAQRVGTVRESDTTEFDHARRAAALFDEDPFVRGRLWRTDGTGAAVLEIPLPERQGGDSGS